MSMTKRFYGDAGTVQQLLRNAMCRGRIQQGFTNKELDGVCMFGQGGVPCSTDFENDPGLINRRVFCRASFLLGLTADSALEADARIPDNAIPDIVEEMKKNRAGAVFGCGGDGTPIPLKDQARVYAILKVLEELG